MRENNYGMLAMLFRMKHIHRWSLMYSTFEESLSVHTLECAFITNFLCNIGNTYYNKKYDTNKLTTYALFHDVTEIITGDMPTPIKYYNSEIKDAYNQIEVLAAKKLLNLLPKELQTTYSGIVMQNLQEDEKKIIKIADVLCAYIKCKKEIRLGNADFYLAYNSIKLKLDTYKAPELDHFIEYYLVTFDMSLDELGGGF